MKLLFTWVRSALSDQLCIALLCTLILSTNSAATDEILLEKNNGEERSSDVVNQDDSVIIERSIVAQGYFDQIDEVLAREEFGRTEYVKAWRLIDSEDKDARKEKFPEWLISLLEWLETRDRSKLDDNAKSLFNFSLILEVILWCVAIVLILLVVIKYREQISSLTSLLRRSEETKQLPATMFGLDIKKESLPDDIVGNAQQYWRNGESRHAVAMLLRASLINLLNDHDCRFYDSNTEAECCLRIDQQVSVQLSHFMHRLVSVWQQIAYAHCLPSNADFESLCLEWQEVFS